MNATLQGLLVHYSADGSTVYVPLPKEHRRTIEGGCKCEKCTRNLEADPSYVPTWDTLAMPAAPAKERKTSTTWIVHFGER